MSSLILEAFWETLIMISISTVLAYVCGFPLGILLVITSKGGISENTALNTVVGVITNVLRSVPFLILLVVLLPVTRVIVGTTLGTIASIVPLTIGAIPIVARMIESSLKEVPYGIIEASKSMGAKNSEIIFRFMIPEAMPSLILGAAINTATILGYSAMAGFVGGGGLGDIAIRYGYYRYDTQTLLITVVILIIILQIIQEFGLRLSAKKRH